jgi:hypothetical protein
MRGSLDCLRIKLGNAMRSAEDIRGMAESVGNVWEMCLFPILHLRHAAFSGIAADGTERC